MPTPILFAEPSMPMTRRPRDDPPAMSYGGRLDRVMRPRIEAPEAAFRFQIEVRWRNGDRANSPSRNCAVGQPGWLSIYKYFSANYARNS